MPTAVPPPGIGTADATVMTAMFAANSDQNEVEPPNAARHAARQAVESRTARTLPLMSSASFLGERRTIRIVAAALRIGGIAT